MLVNLHRTRCRIRRIGRMQRRETGPSQSCGRSRCRRERIKDDRGRMGKGLPGVTSTGRVAHYSNDAAVANLRHGLWPATASRAIRN